MLDETMTYSCAVFEHAGRAARRRAAREATSASASSSSSGPDDHVLEIGCGWGGFALLRRRRVRLPRHRADDLRASRPRSRASGRAAGLATGRDPSSRTTARIEGRYTKVASIEMLEAIGERAVRRPTSRRSTACSRRGGRACVQTILIPDERWDRYRRTPDWIERYVFPGCLIPSLEALDARAAARARGSTIYDVDEIGPHYAETLRRWRANFHERIDEVRALGYDERFERTWDFYLAFCEAAFRTRALRDVQLAAANAPRERCTRVLASRSASARCMRRALPGRGRRRASTSRRAAAASSPPTTSRSSTRSSSASRRPRADPLHGEVRALRESRGRRRRWTRSARSPSSAAAATARRFSEAARAAARRRGARDLPAGHVEAASRAPLAPRRGAARARDRRADRAGAA